MRTVILLVATMMAAGCGSKETPPAESPSTAQSNDPNRKLTKSECDSLGATIVDACNNRGNDRSSKADGWCSDMVRRNESNEGEKSWVGSDCLPHFKATDAFCFNGARNAHAMMSCDEFVDRTQ